MARGSARTASALEELHRGIRTCVACPLHRSRRHAVPGVGEPAPRVVLVGEAPGACEDAQGEPFVGPAGRFLTELLATAGLAREDVYLTNSVKCRPPRNRRPRPGELGTCRALWLDRQLAALAPEVVVLLGRTPLAQVLGEEGRLEDLHGQVRTRDGLRCLVTYHPASGRRFPWAGAAMRADFQTLAALLDAG